MARVIRILGARQHNLKGIDVEIPRRSLTVVTGPSGSGKSSFAFDTVYAEGQRRYVESLSTYAKQFLERIQKPAVDRVEGVSPSVAIDQRNQVKTSRSTVGTVTEVYDYLRLLWSRVGRTFCPECERPVEPDTVPSAVRHVLAWPAGTRFYVTFPLALSPRVGHALVVENLRAMGYLRVLADGREWHLEDLETSGSVDLTSARELLVVVDRLRATPESSERLADALAAAFAEGEGRAVVVRVDGDAGEGWQFGERKLFTEAFRCAQCSREFPSPRPSLFSFNSPTGACPRCTGFGATLEYDLSLIVPDPRRSLAEGAIDPWSKPRYRRQRALLAEWGRQRGVDMSTPWSALPAELRHELIHGGAGFQGVIPFLRSKERKRYKRYIRVFLRQYQVPRVCPECGGSRLRPEALNVRVDGRTIADAASLPIAELRGWIGRLSLSEFERKVAARVLEELMDRLRFLDDVGIGYLTLDRQARTLAGGEMQRIRLASCLGSRLVDTLYVLDEPTIGLHPRDMDRFLEVLRHLRDRGNTLLVVEHEPRVLAEADHILELGPGSGEQGGEVVFQGSWSELRRSDSPTGRALRDRNAGSRPRRSAASKPGIRRVAQARLSLDAPGSAGWIELRGARLHNVQGLDVRFPLGALTVVTGVSGAGKSTLVHDLLYRALERELRGRTTAKEHLGEAAGAYDALLGANQLSDVVWVDASPIGRTPRSNPATYIRAFAEIRRLFAEQPLARKRGYGAGHFSFNVPGGRCERCRGAGVEEVEMVFLADVSVPCEACAGKRFREEILEVKYRGRNVHEVLQLTVDEALRFFVRRDRLGEILWQLQRVGLGYLRLGQPATTLSGGEAQRLKIARELARRSGAGRRLYLMDEPTVGLGLGEISTLMRVFSELIREGHTVVVVEHNLDLIAAADWIVDLGPDAAERGGRLVATGPPPIVAEVEASHTGRYLKEHLQEVGVPTASRAG